MSERRSELKAVAAAEDKGRNGDLMAVTAQVWDTYAQVNSRLIALAQNSWRRTQVAAEEMRQCQSPSEVVEVQLRNARLAMDDYMDEARKMTDLMAKISNDAIGMLRLPK